MSDDWKTKADPVARPTARDALVYATGAVHGHCTVVAKSKRLSTSSQVRFKCACGSIYIIGANNFSTMALRNVPEDKEL